MSFPARDYLDLDRTAHADLFENDTPVWEALNRIAPYLDAKLEAAAAAGALIRGDAHERAVIGPRVWIAPGAVVEANAVIQGPAWIGAGTVVRSGAYLRQHVVAGEGCVLGNSCEFKNALLFDGCEVPHFNYVGDSILGHKAHLGAGVICSNVRLDRRQVRLRIEGGGEVVDTGLRKFGAIVGDRAEVGCNSVLSPGSMLGRDSILYPGTHWQGVLPARRIVKHRQDLIVVGRED
jgi:UDP-N-acetylglucosamine diphosphorylase / glucose-1-phosphate thymidylyltransferase / UDP-N-acetylgalactosamine diphosphorylase / glucosamine-1-phosphate N-acetyltransferase / galactosamine-1-phosphate N-acetyltransferase